MLGDLRYAIRRLIANPGFSIVAVLILALGIGAGTAVFSIVNAALLRPLPGIHDPGRLATVYRIQKSDTFDNSGYPDYLDYRDRNRTFSGFAAHSGTPLSVSTGATERLRGDLVTGNYFQVLGVTPAIGRLIVPGDDRAGNSVAVLGYHFWQRKFAGAPEAVGAKIAINGFPFTVIGVTQRGFTGAVAGVSYDLWVPLATQPQTIPRLTGNTLANRAAGWIDVFGRLKPGISIQRASADLDAIAHQLQQAYPVTNEGRSVKLMSGIGWFPDERAEVGGLLQMLGAAVALLILITCANLAGLFAVRAAGRQREIAVRLAIGAGKARLVRQLFAEGVVVAAVACGAGLLLSGWAARLMASIRPSSALRHLDVTIDGRVLAFAILASAATAVAFALLPALRSLPLDLVSALKDGAAGAGLARSRFRSLLVVGQVAVSFVLLAAAGLLVRNLERILWADPGYETSKLAMGSIDLTLQRYPEAQGIAIYRELLRQLPGIPGVTSATLAFTVPPEEYPGRVSIFHPGEEPPLDVLMGREFDLGLRVDINRVAPHYFQTLGIHLLQGRDFTDRDSTDAPLVAIVNLTLARRMWPNENPIGKRFAWPTWAEPQRPPLEVIGLAADTRSRALAAPAVPLMYVPLLQNYDGRARLIVRTAADPAGALPALEHTLRSVDTDVALFQPETMSTHVADSLWAQRTAMGWIGVFGLLALLLTAIGLYGAIAQSVSRRTRELAVRLALGATPHSLVRLVLSEGARLAALGLLTGLPGALLLSRLFPADPIAYAFAAILLAAVLLIACWLPARRVARVADLRKLTAE